MKDVDHDPFSEAYIESQLKLYEEITGRAYKTEYESTPFDFDYEIQQPYPYSTRSSNTVGDTLIGYGFIIKNLPLEPHSRVLEVGSGYGSLTYHLAPMHVDLTAIDIDNNLLEFVGKRILGFNHRTKLIACDIHEFEDSQPFDIVIFHESFHHCHNHLLVMEKMSRMFSADGVVVFAAEPIIELPNKTLPYPWGIRMDGLSLRCIRQFGWLELGFSRDYFFSMLNSYGWEVQELSIPGHHYTNMIIARHKTYKTKESEVIQESRSESPESPESSETTNDVLPMMARIKKFFSRH